MQRMTGIDPMFVYSDTPETPMEIAYACVFDPAATEGGYAFERVADVLRTRMPTLEPFRRRLMPVPLGLDHPRWVDDPDFDLANHLHRGALPAPGGEAEFGDVVAEVMGRPLTPEQPPWEMHVVEGLARGRVGLIAKVHHSVIDGVAGAELLAQLLDLTPEGSAVTEPCPPWLPPRLPSGARLVTDALPSLLRSPIRALRAVREVGRTAVRLARARGGRRLGPVSIPLGAPATFESPVGARRAVVVRRAGHGAGARRSRSASGRRSTTSCSPSAPARCGRTWPPTTRTSTARWWPSCRCRCAARTTVRRWATSSRPCSCPSSNDLKTPLERLRTVTAASASCKGQERAVGYGPMATLLADAVPPALVAADDPARGPLGCAAQAPCRQPHGLQRARPGLPALLRRHGAAAPCTRSGRWSTAWRSTSPCRATATRSSSGSTPAPRPCRTCPA